MEENNYKWLLRELASQNAYFPVLETGICRGDTLLDWYLTEDSGKLISKSLRSITRTKHLITHFLNKRSPAIGEYFSDKYFIYIYFKQGAKVLTAKEAENLAENQLHGLQLRSVHLATPTSHPAQKIFKIYAWEDQGELTSELRYGSLTERGGEVVKDTLMGEKALRLVKVLAHTCNRTIKSLQFSMVIDTEGTAHMLKINDLEFEDSSRPSIKKNIKLLPLDDEESLSVSQSDDDESPLHAPFRILSKPQSNSSHCLKLPSLKKQNNNYFIEMIAKTFDKRRRRRSDERFMNNNPNFPQKKEFWTQSIGKFKKKGLNSMNDLLYYIEKTRPPVWMKDRSVEAEKAPAPLSDSRKFAKSSSLGRIKKFNSSVVMTMNDSPRKKYVGLYVTQKNLRQEILRPCLQK